MNPKETKLQTLPMLVIVIVLVALAAAVSGCVTGERSDNLTDDQTEQIRVAVSILPQKEFVERVGGDKVSVMVMIPPGASPATYEPSPSQLREIAVAKLYVRIGHVPFEKAWMERIASANRDMLIIDSSVGIEIIGKDPHIWLSPTLVKVQVGHICDALVEVDPDNRDYYVRNKEKYRTELDDLDYDIRESLSGVTNRKFMVFHPAFGYFARDYQMEQIPIEIEGKEPSASDLVRLVDVARTNNITVVFAEPQFNPEGAEVIASEIGGTVVFIDPLAEDFVTNMHRISDALARHTR